MDRFTRLETLFHAASALPHSQREAFLRNQASADPALIEDVLRLLSATPAAESQIESWAGGFTIPAGLAQFGPYRVIRLLGRGGMGAVYLAERADGEYAQQVALKVLSPHLAGEAFAARFRTERQLLAQMNHPNIVRLLDGGVAATGEPFLVTEFVDGEPLDAYCDKLRLPLRNRIRLLIDVCSAVIHAHRNLVIHRDLKPANVLVDKSGAVKLLDFGTAKLLDATERTDVTTLPLLTPRYASPEQLRNAPLTIASDVYSLGLASYELLAGHRAFEIPNDIARELARSTEDLPVLLLGSRSTPEAAAVRATLLTTLKKQLSGDLAAIALRAVAYSPAQRYQSVEEFRDDLLAFLESRPVHARPITFTYRARKFIARRRYLVGAASALLIVAASGFIATVRQRSIAEERFSEVRRLARYQLFDLYDQAELIPGTLRLRSSMAAGSLSYLDRLAGQRNLDPELAVEVAQGYRRLGDLQGNFAKATLGNPAEAIRIYQRGLALLAPFQSVEAARRVHLEIEASSAIAAVTSGQGGQAFSVLLDVISRLESAQRSHPTDDSFALLLARALMAAFSAGPSQGVPKAETDARGRKVLEILKPGTGSPQFRMALAEFYRFSAVAMVDLKPSEARVAVESGLKTLDLLPPGIRASAVARKARAAFLMTLAAASRAEGDSRRALDEIEEPLSIVRELADDPDDLQACANLALILENRSLMRWDAEDYQGYVNDLSEALPLTERLVGAGAGTRFRMLNLSVLRGLAFGHDKLNSPQRDKAVRRAYEELKRAAKDDSLGYKPKVDLADMLLNVPLDGALRPDEALEYAQAGVRLQPDALNCWESVAEANRQLRRYPEALAAIDRALATIDPPKPGEPPAHFHLSLQRKQRQIMQQMAASPAQAR